MQLSKRAVLMQKAAFATTFLGINDKHTRRIGYGGTGF